MYGWMRLLFSISINFVYFTANLSLAYTFKRPNIILILTDDQDVILNGLKPMEQLQRLIGNAGITFTSAITSSPICCPSRASILSGLYAHNHKVKNNSISGGCYDNYWKDSIEPHTIAPILHENGYNTFFAGKYLNEFYGHEVPTGWDYFNGLHGNSKYYDYTIRENNRNVSYKNVYLTDLISKKTVAFIRKQQLENKPFFAMIAPPAPHAPFIPAERHKNSFTNVKAPRTPNFNTESNFLEKHWLVAAFNKLNSTEIIDKYFRSRWETLLSVDELIMNVYNCLEMYSKLDETFIIYTSDNGYHIGQFAQPYDKRQPYETDIRVPIILRGPNIPKNITLNAPIALIDLFPTIIKWANISYSGNFDGLLIPKVLLENKKKNYSGKNGRKILIEYWGEGTLYTFNDKCPWKQSDLLDQCTIDAECHCQDSWNNTYACIREFGRDISLYCEFSENQSFIEVYNLENDLWQMKNIANKLLPYVQSLKSLTLANLKHCSGTDCKTI